MMDGITFASALKDAVALIPDILKYYTSAPGVYFVAAAFLGACAGIARKFVPMKRR